MAPILKKKRFLLLSVLFQYLNTASSEMLEMSLLPKPNRSLFNPSIRPKLWDSLPQPTHSTLDHTSNPPLLLRHLDIIPQPSQALKNALARRRTTRLNLPQMILRYFI